MVVARLKAAAGVVALVNGRIYDAVPRTSVGSIDPAQKFPFIAWEQHDEITEDADELPGASLRFVLGVWSRAVGFPEVLKVADAVKQALHDDDTLSLSTNALANLQHIQTQAIRDPDGQTSHGVLIFEAFVEVK